MSPKLRVTAALFAATLTATASASASAQQVARQTEGDDIPTPVGTMLIQNLDAVWTAAGPVQHNVSILIRDGIIREIGPNVAKPNNASVIDGRGMTAIPGVAILLTVLAINLVGEGLNDALNPRQSRR